MDILEVIQTIPAVSGLIRILKKDNKPIISIKHLIVKSDFVINQIIKNKFVKLYEELHSKRIYLYKNEIFGNLEKMFRDHIIENNYESWEKTPVKDIRDKNSDIFEKEIGLIELKDLIKKHDPIITNNILTAIEKDGKQINPDNFCKVKYIYDPCGDSISESIQFKPIWLVMLWIENISDKPVKIESYNGEIYYPHNGLEYRPFKRYEGEDYKKDVPAGILQKGECIFIPEYILLAPLENYLDEEEIEIKCDDFKKYYGFIYNLTNIKTKDDFYLIGASLNINHIKVESRFEEIHELKLENMLTISEFFNVGSCPCIIGCKSRKFYFIKNILIENIEQINIRDFEYLIIAELENETAFLKRVIISNEVFQKELLRNKILQKGGFILINNTKHNTKLIIEGEYFSKFHHKNNKFIRLSKYQNLSKFISYISKIQIQPERIF